MKILIITFSDNADHQDAAFGLYEQLCKRKDVEPFLLCMKAPKVALEAGPHVWQIDAPKRPGICRSTFNLSLLCRTLKRIRRERFDVIFFQSLHVWNLPILVVQKGISTSYHMIHDVIPHKGDRQTGMVELMNKALVRLADYIVLANKTYSKYLLERYHISEERVKTLELWRRYSDFSSPSFSGRFLFFGRINPYKGAENLLAIARTCKNAHFDVVGRVDSQMVEVVDKLKELPNVDVNSDYVSDDEMRQAFLDSDWLILPYHSATQSGIIVDAYRYSRPVLAFDVGAIREQVDHERSGYLIPAGDTASFSKRVEQVMAMPREDYLRMCRSAYEFGVKKYSSETAVESFMEMVGSNKHK